MVGWGGRGEVAGEERGDRGTTEDVNVSWMQDRGRDVRETSARAGEDQQVREHCAPRRVVVDSRRESHVRRRNEARQKSAAGDTARQKGKAWRRGTSGQSS